MSKKKNNKDKKKTKKDSTSKNQFSLSKDNGLEDNDSKINNNVANISNLNGEKGRKSQKSKNKNESLEKYINLFNKFDFLFIIIALIIIILVWSLKIDLKNFKFSPQFDLNLLFTNTILTGGDSCSWYQVLDHLKNHLLPNGRIVGNTLTNFFGYNEFQHYFPLPFLIAAILGFFMPLTIALKITTMIGLFSLPFSFFYSVKKITKNNILASSSAVLSLIFIFNESYTMFGGNVLSTMAGEFCYSFAISLFVLLIGLCYDAFINEKISINIPAVVLGLIALSHIFVFMVAFFLPFFFIFTKKSNDPKNKILEKIFFTYMVAMGIASFWLIPMVLTRQYAASITLIWTFANFNDFFKFTMFGFIILGVSLNIFTTIISKNKLNPSFLLYMFLVSAFLYFISPLLGIADIRFVPTAIIASIFSIIIFFNYVVNEDNSLYNVIFSIIIFIVSVTCTLLFVKFNVKNGPAWFKWNYTGYESKIGYNDLQEIIKATNEKELDKPSRLLWEKVKGGENSDFGSERGFENLYLFTGRGSTEGIHYGSSFMAKPVTYMQTEYSVTASGPESYRMYASINPESWKYRFIQTNSKDIIIHTDEMKNHFSNNELFEKSIDIGKWSIYNFKNHIDSYIDIIDPNNISIIGSPKNGSWQKDFYRFFREYELIEYPFIPKKYTKKGDKNTKGLETFDNYDQYRDNLVKQGKEVSYNKWYNEKLTNSTFITNEKIDHFSIKFDTDKIGMPHVIKVSYSPNFKSKNGEKIYPIAPGFMLIIPETNNVEIHYDYTLVEIIGLIVTLLSIIFIIISGIIYRRISFPYYTLLKKGIISIFFAIVVIFVLITISPFTQSRAISNKNKAEKIYYDQKIDNAIKIIKVGEIVDKYATDDFLNKYDNGLAFHFMKLKIYILQLKNDEEGAKKLIDKLKVRYKRTREFESHFKKYL